jgi:hypothetical protein
VLDATLLDCNGQAHEREADEIEQVKKAANVAFFAKQPLE